MINFSNPLPIGGLYVNILKMNSPFVVEYEMAEIQNNQDLNRSSKRALKDVKAQRGHAVRNIYNH